MQLYPMRQHVVILVYTFGELPDVFQTLTAQFAAVHVPVGIKPRKLVSNPVDVRQDTVDKRHLRLVVDGPALIFLQTLALHTELFAYVFIFFINPGRLYLISLLPLFQRHQQLGIIHALAFPQPDEHENHNHHGRDERDDGGYKEV